MNKYLIFLFIVVMISCAKDDLSVDKSEKTDYIFQYEYRCGWCFGAQQITITGNELTFVHEPYCDLDSQNEKTTLSDDDLEDLNLEELLLKVQQMQLNECGVCYDGCDEVIRFIVGEQTYEIIFDDDEQVIELMDHVEKLREITAGYVDEN